jgi:hypothetical protein
VATSFSAKLCQLPIDTKNVTVASLFIDLAPSAALDQLSCGKRMTKKKPYMESPVPP